MSLKRHHGAVVPLTRAALSAWQESTRAQRLLQLEARETARQWPEVFGRHLLQIGAWDAQGHLLGGAETLHRAVLGTFSEPGVAAVIDPARLPFADKSVDAVLLPHTLEFAGSPHEVLREINRVLNDRGRLFILGFNPWSGWALRRWLGLGHRAFPRGAHFYSAGRVCDWLQLLDFEISEVRRFGVGFPWLAPHNAGEAWHPGILLQGFAESYLLAAKKRVLPMNFVGRAPRAQVRPLVGLPVPAASVSANREPPTL